MNWDAIAAAGELLGAGGVIVTLVFLAVQIRSNTRTVRASAMRDVEEDWAKTNDWLAQDPKLALMVLSHERGEEVGDASAVAQGVLMARATLQRIAAAYHMYRSGLLDEEIWQARLRTIDAYIFSSALGDVWTPQTKLLFSDSFVTMIECRIAERRRPSS